MEPEGQTFGRYEILRQIGSGGMGEIYVARQTGIPGVERLVVIKKVLPHLAREPGFIERFLDEMRVATMLTHGNIVQVYEAGEADGQYYMAMEFVDGLDLRRILALLKESSRTMPEDLALYVLSEAAKGLAYAHDRCDANGARLNIVHRDVSPANLLLSMDGQVKLTDFGVALATARLSLSVPGTLHGKVAYMSPEQVSGDECDARSDVFGLGVVAYEMLTGKRPFDAETEVAIIEQVRLCDPVPICEAGQHVSASLGGIVSRAMAREPDERYPSMNEFLRALSDYAMGNQITISAASMSEFLEGLSPRDGQFGAAGKDVRSLDDVAAELLDAKRNELDTGAGPGPVAAPSPRPTHDEPEWSFLQVMGAVLIIVVMGGGLWLLGRVSGLSDEPGGVEDHTDMADLRLDATVADPGVMVDVPAPPDVAVSSADRVVATGDAVNSGSRDVPVAVKSRRISLTSVPEGAGVYSGARMIGRTPMSVTVSSRGSLRLGVRKDGYEPLTITLGVSSPPRMTVKLERQPSGRVKFRFFPANAFVYLDGRLLKVKGNVVDVEVETGVHEVELRSASGDRNKKAQVTVVADRTAQLGTLELGMGVEGVR